MTLRVILGSVARSYSSSAGLSFLAVRRPLNSDVVTGGWPPGDDDEGAVLVSGLKPHRTPVTHVPDANRSEAVSSRARENASRVGPVIMIGPAMSIPGATARNNSS